MKQLSKKISSSSKNKAFTEATIQEVLELQDKQYPQYQNFDYLADGSSSIILKATNKENSLVAIKVVAVEENIAEIEGVKRRYNQLQQVCKYSYVLSVNSCLYLRNAEKQMYFIIEMEMCKNTLAQLLKNFRKDKINLGVGLKNRLAIQMLDAANMLHKKDIVHKDIRSANILISHNPSSKDTLFFLKLGDLGIASQLKGSTPKSSFKGTHDSNPQIFKIQLLSSIGKVRSARYTPIEGKYRKESDLFSLGIVLLELDSYLTFDYSKVSDLDFSLLQREGIKALSKYELNRQSDLYEIASTFLNTNYKQRSSSVAVLELFLQKQQYASTTVCSIITEEIVLSETRLEIPIHVDSKSQQIEEISFSIKDSTSQNTFSLEGKNQAIVHERVQITRKENLSAQKKLEQSERDSFIPPEKVKLALKSLYEQKRFRLFSLLGRGAQGIVFSVRNVAQMRDSVLKLCVGNDKIQTRRYISVLKKVSSPYIVKLYDFGYFSDEKKNEYVWFEFEKCRCTLTHFLDQNMEEVHNNPQLKESFALQILDSVNTLHLSEVLHGNIKPDNFLVSSDDSGRAVIKLADFYESGLLNQPNYEPTSEYGEDPQENKDKLIQGRNCLFLRGKYGTPAFRSPERFLTRGFPSTFISEIFSVGLCLLLLDNYVSLEKVFVSNYFSLLSPFSIPFINCHQL